MVDLCLSFSSLGFLAVLAVVNFGPVLFCFGVCFYGRCQFCLRFIGGYFFGSFAFVLFLGCSVTPLCFVCTSLIVLFVVLSVFRFLLFVCLFVLGFLFGGQGMSVDLLLLLLLLLLLFLSVV